MSFWAPDRTLHVSFSAAKQKNYQRIWWLNFMKQENYIEKISKELRMPISSVQTLSKKWEMRDSVETRPWSGRPTNISATTARKIVWDAKKDPQITSAGIQDCMSVLYARRKPLLRQCHKAAHLQYAKQHRNKPQILWNKVIWSNEFKNLTFWPRPQSLHLERSQQGL